MSTPRLPIEVERDGRPGRVLSKNRGLEPCQDSVGTPQSISVADPFAISLVGKFVSPGFFNGFGIVTPLDEGDEAKDTGNYINHYLTPRNTEHLSLSLVRSAELFIG